MLILLVKEVFICDLPTEIQVNRYGYGISSVLMYCRSYIVRKWEDLKYYIGFAQTESRWLILKYHNLPLTYNSNNFLP